VTALTGLFVTAALPAQAAPAGSSAAEVTASTRSTAGRSAVRHRPGRAPVRGPQLRGLRRPLRRPSAAGNFDIVMNYDRLLWETGDASGAEVFGCNNVTCGRETDTEVIEIQR
jgi:hypothetical protein